MRTFRTVIPPVSYNIKINYDTRLLFIGSCFTENIGKQLKELKFNVKINPFGIVYNPVSVSNVLNIICNRKEFVEKDLIFFDEYWHSMLHHGKFSGKNKKVVLQNINNEIKNAYDYLKNTDIIFLTFGTAWVYEYLKTKSIAANCHKIPSKQFNKYLLNTEEIVEKISKTVNVIRKINPKLKFFFSISPVRHLKDGFSENFISKSILRVAAEEICKSISDTYYFPAFEILNDDLRDYRFYGKDMVHPNESAIEYIFNFFKQSFFSEETILINDKIKKIIQSISHRIFDVNTKQSKKFIHSLLNEINTVKKNYPFFNFDEEQKNLEALK